MNFIKELIRTSLILFMVIVFFIGLSLISVMYFTKNMSISALIKNFVVFSSLSLFVIGLFLSVTVFLYNKKMSSPLQLLIDNMNSIFTGKTDFHNLDIDVSSEIGILSLKVMKYVEKINKNLYEVKTINSTTKDISSNLAATLEESGASFNQIKTNIENIKNKTMNLNEDIVISNQSSSQVRSFIANVVNLISSQSSAINQSSAAIEEMSSSVQNIARISEEKLAMTVDLEKIAHEGQDEMKETIEIIYKITNSAKVMMNMIKVINEIASQTNLLAMNAAIEAAHAGDYGRGFSVVADEIRALAESTSKNSKEISNSLKEVVGFINKSEEITNRTGSSLESIVTGIKKVSDSMVEMKNAMSELSIGSTEIMKSLEVIIKTTQEVRVSAGDMDSKVGNVMEVIDNLGKVSGETKNGMIEVEAGISELYKGLIEVAEIGNQNLENINKLDYLTEKFLVFENTSSKSEEEIEEI